MPGKQLSASSPPALGLSTAAASSGGIQAHGSPLLPLSGGYHKALGNPLRYQEVDVQPSQQPEPLLPAGGHTLAVP